MTSAISFKFPESICVGRQMYASSSNDMLEIDFNGRYDLINSSNSNQLPTYYSSDSKQYLYPLSLSNISYFRQKSSTIETVATVNGTHLEKYIVSDWYTSPPSMYYFISNKVNDANISNLHCLFNKTAYNFYNNTTFDLSVLCSNWMTLFFDRPNEIPEETFTTYHCPLDSSCLTLTISNAYHKFCNGIYKLDHWNYTLRGAVYYCSECNNNGGIYMYPWITQQDAQSVNYYYQMDDEFTDSYASEWCILRGKNNKYIFNIDDCSGVWDAYHDADWYHDENIVINHTCLSSSATVNSNNHTRWPWYTYLSVFVVVGICCLICIKKHLKPKRCCLICIKKHLKPKRSRRQYCKPSILKQEFELCEQKEMDSIFNNWDESEIDWRFVDDDQKKSEVSEIEIKSSSTNCVVVNAYYMVEKGLKECFVGDWNLYLEKFKKELITDEALMLVQGLDDEKQTEYLQKVIEPIGDLLKFKQWLSSADNLDQVEGM